MATPDGVPVTGAVSGEHTTVEDFSNTGVAPLLAAVADPNRLFILVMFATASGRISPAPGSMAFGLGPDVGGVPGGRLIHHSAFPGLIQGEWYIFDSSGGPIRVYDVGRA